MKTLARPEQAQAPAKAAADPANPAADRPDEGLEARIVRLGQQAGNQAVASLLGERAKPVQREDDRTALFGAMAQSDVLDQSVDSTPVEQMSYSQVGEEIHRYERWLAKQTGSSALENARSERLILLRGRMAAFATPTKKKAGSKGPRLPKPPRPKSLDGDFNPWQAKRADVDAELNAIVAYLASGPSKAERKKLESARLSCEAVVGEGEERHDEAIRRADVSIGLSSTAGGEDEQMKAILGKIEGIRPDPERKGVYLLQVGTTSVPVAEAELKGLQGNVTDELSKISSELLTVLDHADNDYEARMEKARDHPWVHGLASWTSSAEEPQDMDGKVKAGRNLQRQAVSNLHGGHFLEALRLLGILESFVKYEAEKVGKWEGDLNFGAGRWLLATTILKDGLTILATAGAAGLTKTLVTEGASLGSAALTVGGASTLAGGLGAGGASLADQASKGDVSLGKTLGAVRTGAASGATIGFGGAATMYAQEAFGVAKAVSTTGKVLKTVGAATAANTTVNVGGAIVGGTSVKDAAITSLVTSPLAAAGNLGVEGLAGGSKAVEAIGKVVVGSGTGALGATAIGGSDTDILHGALTGGAGSLYGSAQEAMGDVPAAKPSAPKALPAGEPEPEPGAGTTTSPAPTSGEEPTATPAGGSSPVATGEELAVSVAKQQGHEDEMYGPRRVEEELETDFGMPAENQHKIQQAADLAGVIVEIRPTNPASVARLRQGNLPKPMDIKANTVNELDVHLGARPEDVGLVASFLPNEPVRTPAMSDETWAKVQARYGDRSQSYDEQAYTLNELTKPVAEQNPAITHQKIQVRIDEHGVVRTSVPVRGGGTREVGFTGDHDLFLFRNPHTGAEITDPDHVAYVMGIIEGEAAIEHPPLKNWETVGDKQANLKASLVQRHEGKGEPLVVFAPGRVPTLRDARQ